jgi:hypothetical protein
MVRLPLVIGSLVLLLGGLPASAQNAGDVLQGIGRAMTGEPAPPPPDYRSRDRDWRERDRERAYRQEQRRLDAEQRDLDARRRGLQSERRYNEENGFYGR